MARTVHPDALAAARVGAGWAFERVYAALGPPVLGYLAAQGAPDPESALNEVFLRAFRGLTRFDGTGDQLRSWVFAIAHNLLVDERRTAGRRPSPVPLDDLDPMAGDAEDDAFERLGTDRVNAVLAVLAPDQREVIVLRFVADLSLAGVAEATGRSLTAVKALQHRGLDALRRQLGEILPLAVSP